MSTVALVQLEINDTESVSDRHDRVVNLVRSLAGTCDFVVLPELWHVGAFDVELGLANAQDRQGPVVTSLCDVARETGLWIHAGSFVEQHEGGISNTSVVISAEGHPVTFYRKIHLFGFDEGEAARLDRGDSLITLPNTPLGHVGLATCYDLRFPELFRGLTEAGAQVLMISSGWPTPRINHWDILTQARAIENQAWVVACNEVGTHGGVTLGGHSVVIDPHGNIVAQAGGAEEVIYAEIDVELADHWRANFPVLKDRVIR